MIKATIKTGEKGELELEGTAKEITEEVADLHPERLSGTG